MPLVLADRILDNKSEFPNDIVVAASVRSVELRQKFASAIDDALWREPD